MAAKTPEERSLSARIASAERWGHTASTEARRQVTEPARAGLRAKFEREALATYPDLTGDELARAVDDLMRAHMLRMSLAAKRGRRKAAEHTAEADAAEAELAQIAGDDARQETKQAS